MFSFLSKFSRMRTPHPLDVIKHMLEMNNQQRKKQYKAKRGYPPRLLDYQDQNVLKGAIPRGRSSGHI